MTRARIRLVVGCVLSLALVGPLGWMWWSSLVPSSYSVMDMGYLDYGGGPHRAPHEMSEMAGMGGMGRAHGMDTSVADLTGPTDRTADVTVELVARKQVFHLASGRRVDGYTFNGTSPGPTITVTEGQLLEVHVRNADVPDGMTVHWHGVNLPNAEDGVAGVTQNAIAPGSSYTYRFVANHAGTYWYHSHQASHEQVLGGLFGALVVLPRTRTAESAHVKDVVAVSHTYDGVRTLNGHDHVVPVEAAGGQQVRVRIVNTDNLPLTAWAGAPWRLTAVDGYAVHGPTPVSGQSLDVPAGGRAAIELTVPDDGSAVRVMIDDDTSLVVGPKGAAAPKVALPGHDLDLLGYGTPAALPFDPDEADRRFVYDIGRKPGFLDGRPGMQWTVNGHIFPDMPMFVVAEGDIVQIHIENHSGVVHPMHIHGHHAVVLARNGKPSTGSPWWLDSLDVADGDSYDIAFLADNPGVWMDHCHNLTHAAQGLVTHLMYEGVTDPYRIGGPAGNEPE